MKVTKLTALEFEIYDTLVQTIYAADKHWRLGQTYFNILEDYHPTLANEVRGRSFDPFYVDGNLPEFFNFIKQ